MVDTPSVAEATETLLATMDLDATGHAYASVMRVLAVSLDHAQHVDGGALAAAIPGISREWRDCVDSILKRNQTNDELAASILDGIPTVGDGAGAGSADARW